MLVDNNRFHMPEIKLEPRSIEEYIEAEKANMELVLWVGGNLKPFVLIKNQYQWQLFPVHLQPSVYRLALELKTNSNEKPVIAYAIIFSPDSETYKNYPLSNLGFGFHETPAISNHKSPFLLRNLCEYHIHHEGRYTIGVTTRNSNAYVEKVNFEVAILRKYRY